MHQLVGLHGQLRQMGAKGFGHDLFGFVQMRAGVDQITSCLHGDRAANVLQNGGNSIGMREGVLSGIQHFTGNQWLGKGTGFGPCFGLFGRISGGQHDGWQKGRMQTPG